TGHCSLETGHWPLLTAHCSLETGHWSLVTAHWSLATELPDNRFPKKNDYRETRHPQVLILHLAPY
ncbi:MAG: hypothetical protein ACK2U5_23975, partial [Candidatus Promineifilaceae bacterium]